MHKFSSFVVVFSLTLVLVGCTRTTETPGPTPGNKVADTLPSTDKVVLAAEPTGAKNIGEVKKAAQDKAVKNGDSVVLIGRIAAGGKKSPFTGKASFSIADLKLEPCDDEGCGDYFCGYTSKEIAAASVLVKFVDDQGQTQPQDAKTWLKLKDLQTVVVQGKACCDPEGLMTSVEVTALFPRAEVASTTSKKE